MSIGVFQPRSVSRICFGPPRCPEFGAKPVPMKMPSTVPAGQRARWTSSSRHRPLRAKLPTRRSGTPERVELLSENARRLLANRAAARQRPPPRNRSAATPAIGGRSRPPKATALYSDGRGLLEHRLRDLAVVLDAAYCRYTLLLQRRVILAHRLQRSDFPVGYQSH
jgi:hypothetical protein